MNDQSENPLEDGYDNQLRICNALGEAVAKIASEMQAVDPSFIMLQALHYFVGSYAGVCGSPETVRVLMAMARRVLLLDSRLTGDQPAPPASIN